jgi:hypothetical protein
VATQHEASKEALVRSDAPSICASFTHDQHRDDCFCGPPQQPSLAAADALLDVQRTENVLDVGDDGLDFDHEQDSPKRLVSQEIDPAAVTVAIEADLSGHGPSEGFEPSGKPLAQPGVVGVTQSTEFRTAESGIPVQPEIQGCADSPDRSHGVSLGVPTLKQAHQTAAHPGAPREILLPPAASMPQRAYGCAQSGVVHCPILPPGALPGHYQRLIGVQVRCWP